MRDLRAHDVDFLTVGQYREDRSSVGATEDVPTRRFTTLTRRRWPLLDLLTMHWMTSVAALIALHMGLESTKWLFAGILLLTSQALFAHLACRPTPAVSGVGEEE